MTENRMNMFSKIDQIGVVIEDLEKAARLCENFEARVAAAYRVRKG
ncbi:MAG: hypothetical protein ACP5JW_03110 [Candidatus Bathyarchaeia archaeon]